MADSKVITQNDIKNILAHINLGDDAHKEITQVEFNALSQAEKNDGTIYFITDGVSGNTFLEDNVPIGTITPYGGDSDPDYWLICDGRAISRTTYADLFAVIGTTYGTGDGSTTFNIPDLRGNVAVGASAIYDLGDSGGEATHTLNQNELPAISGSLPHQAYGESAVSGVFSVVDSGANVDQAANASSPTNRHYELHFGNNQPHNNMQPYVVTNYIIKAYSTVSEHQATVDFFYPVGSYYETSDSTFDPNIELGGTWIETTINTQQIKQVQKSINVTPSTGASTGGYYCYLGVTSNWSVAADKILDIQMISYGGAWRILNFYRYGGDWVVVSNSNAVLSGTVVIVYLDEIETNTRRWHRTA